MELLYPRCAAIDVHKRTAVAAVAWADEAGRHRREVRTFATTTSALERLRDWLAERGVTHVAMESTGVYWKPCAALSYSGPARRGELTHPVLGLVPVSQRVALAPGSWGVT